MGRRLLLVEGKDDVHVVRHLCRSHGIDAEKLFAIELPRGEGGFDPDEGGVERLLDQIPVRLKESDVERLGVVLDADENAENRWIQLRDRLRRAGYHGVPDSPTAHGTVVNFHDEFGDSVRLGVWIMPDNRLPGMLEDFLAFLIPDDDELMPHVDAFLAGIPPTAHNKFSESAAPKARIHTYLAVQKEPGKPLGLAITFRYLRAQKSQALPFVSWLRSVLID